MRHNQSWLLILVLAAVMSSTIYGQTSRSARPAPNHPGATRNCLLDDAVSATIRNLSSANSYQDQQKAVALLKNNATRSPVCRKQVITRLLSAMDQPNLDLTGGTPQFYLWHYGVQVLGELKAVEALDLLIANFDLHDGSAFPLNHHPALGGVINLGELALPKLEAVLRQDPNRYTRRYAVFCIAQIGGQPARQILKRALESESDSCVASCIRASLISFDNRRRPNHISDEGRTTWYTTFLCNGE